MKADGEVVEAPQPAQAQPQPADVPVPQAARFVVDVGQAMKKYAVFLNEMWPKSGDSCIFSSLNVYSADILCSLSCLCEELLREELLCELSMLKFCTDCLKPERLLIKVYSLFS